MSAPLLSSVPFGAFLAYNPRPVSELARRAKDVTLRLKADAALGQETMSQYAARRLREELPGSLLEDLFGRSVLLVPAPRSSKEMKNSLWPADRICAAMVAEGLAREHRRLLRRAVAVPKAAFAGMGGYGRPSPKLHLATLEVRGALAESPAPDEILVVDDVITRGAMLLACVSLLRHTFLSTRIRAFAVIRTMSFNEIQSIVAPCRGEIEWDGETTHRTV